MAAARVTVADVWVDGQLVPAGSDDSHELAEKITNPAAWDGEQPPAKAKHSSIK